MTYQKRSNFSLFISILFLTGLTTALPPVPNRATAEKLFADGNYAEAYTQYAKLVLAPSKDAAATAADFMTALNCLQKLNRLGEMDDFREKAVAANKGNWRLLLAAAQSFSVGPQYGTVVNNKFVRGRWDYSKKNVRTESRDRVRALQLFVQAFPAVAREPNRTELSPFYIALAATLARAYDVGQTWRLQYLTDLTELPDFEERNSSGSRTGAPVDAEGNPVFHGVPKTWGSAQSDGERWRWALVQAAEANPAAANTGRLHFANYLSAQFGVETLAEYRWYFGRGNETDGTSASRSAVWELHTLAEDETIAKLAGGIKRFKLPDEYNFIAIYKSLNAYRQLAVIFENRRQYSRAANYWRKDLKQRGQWDRYKDKPSTYTEGPGKDDPAWGSLRKIIGNWGEFDAGETQSARKPDGVNFRFRNGRKVHFEARSIRVDKLLTDVKAYLKSDPRELDWEKFNIENLGYRIVQKDQKKYVGEPVAAWDLDLDPRPNYFDRRITVPVPFKKGGAYFLTARMEGGNTSHLVLWLADLVLLQKNVDSGSFFFVADAQSGVPRPDATLDFFGYRTTYEYSQTGRNRARTTTREFAEHLDNGAQLVLDSKDYSNDHQWLIQARTPDGKMAFLGFRGLWSGRAETMNFDQDKAFIITDRPVYRPSQVVRFKIWADRARYDREGKSPFAGQTVFIRIDDPLGTNVMERQATLDEYGGMDGEFSLGENATLGQYQLSVSGPASAEISFGVEEYKKPEFEVTVTAPEEPVRLGERVTAGVKATYYFGAPVTEATVKYKILRSEQDSRWFPVGPWDWFYGRGYGWVGVEYSWWPQWSRWGCRGPLPWWGDYWRNSVPPELVAEGEAPIGKDGALQLPIDTALAQALHPDQDHRYDITVEVTDRSRRTIVGQGSVLVTRQPFNVYAWTDRGHYQLGDAMQARFSAVTGNQKPVINAAAKVVLYQVTYDSPTALPREVPVQTWNLKTNTEGQANVQVKAAQPGQYRLSGTLTDTKGRSVEGGCVFVVRGEGFDGTGFRFNDIELVADRREYAPGQTARFMVNTNRRGSHVLFFARPVNGVYAKPELLRFSGKSVLKEIPIEKGDMPNFFVEAVTISGGRVYSETREVIVPPENRVLKVDVLPSAKDYKPGQKAEVKLRVTDQTGHPFRGTLALSVYDKSVEYISGGSNVPDIRESFWKWRRSHWPGTESSLDRFGESLAPKDQIPMGYLGIFGYSLADEKTGHVDRKATRREDFGSQNLTKKSMELSDALHPMASASVSEDKEGVGAGAPVQQAPLVQPVLRVQFADTAHWVARLDTDANGEAKTRFTMPDNLTTWKTRVWAMGDGARCGEGTVEVVAKKNLLLRLQAPRFFVQKDEVVLSANVHNYLTSAKQVRVSLELEGNTLEQISPSPEQLVTIASGGETRVDWRVRAVQPGEAIIRMKALTDEESDAAEMRFPVHVHGMLKTESFCGTLQPQVERGGFSCRVPAERRPEESRLEIRYSPTLALAMVDALPYLVDYPYGCTEQTLNRFLPTVITQNALKRMGVRLEDVRNKITNLNAQEIGDDARHQKDWERRIKTERWENGRWVKRNPVFDEQIVTAMVKTGLEKLTAMQCSDGGWGWFSGDREYSTPHTTAVAVRGLQIARANGVAIVAGVLERGIGWLANHQKERVAELKKWEKNSPQGTPPVDSMDAFIHMILVDEKKDDPAMRDFLYRGRNNLSVYAKAQLGLALHAGGHTEERDMLLRNIRQYVVRDEENQTSYLRLGNENYWWYWYGSEIEANAYALKLFAAVEPQGGTASGLVKYLLNNRRNATYWNSTRDTALVVEAFADYLKATGEDRPDMTVTIDIDGQKMKQVTINAENLFTFDNKLVLTGNALTDGSHKITIKKVGKGPLYWNGYLTNFTLEDSITKAGLEIKVDRAYYKLVPRKKSIKDAGSRGQVVDRRVEKYDRVPLASLAEVGSGDQVLVDLTIESKNDYEYVVFEDMKPAGFEAVDIQSGYGDNGLGAYMELRDERVAFFLRALGRGRHSLSYRLRAEIPGSFSALPTRACAMYAPELKANSDEFKWRVDDR